MKIYESLEEAKEGEGDIELDTAVKCLVGAPYDNIGACYPSYQSPQQIVDALKDNGHGDLTGIVRVESDLAMEEGEEIQYFIYQGFNTKET